MPQFSVEMIVGSDLSEQQRQALISANGYNTL
jgi:hypothetical protein